MRKPHSPKIYAFYRFTVEYGKIKANYKITIYANAKRPICFSLIITLFYSLPSGFFS